VDRRYSAQICVIIARGRERLSGPGRLNQSCRAAVTDANLPDAGTSRAGFLLNDQLKEVVGADVQVERVVSAEEVEVDEVRRL
jgi:hypothetical protein